jgi:hypothetical protein
VNDVVLEKEGELMVRRRKARKWEREKGDFLMRRPHIFHQ